MDPEKSRDIQAGMVRRIGGWILGLTIAAAAAAWAWRGGMSALSVALGGGLALFGYRTHIQVVDRALERQHGRGTLWRMLLRYGLILVFLYGMIRLSLFDIQGFIIGLLLPAAAVLVEAAGYLVKNLRGR
jgi:hypothetical protein